MLNGTREGMSASAATRYMRQIVLPGFGFEGQRALAGARVLVIGAGGLGSPVVAYLAAAGIGTIGIVDDDRVAVSNLQRQIVYRSDQIGVNKVDAAAGFAQALNPESSVETHCVRLEEQEAAARLAGLYDIVVDGSDNVATRRLVAAAAREAGVPLVSGAVSLFDGQVTVFPPDDGGASFEAIFGEALDERDVPTCEMIGVLGAAAGVVGSLMVVEVVKLLTGLGQPLVGRVLIYDGLAGTTFELANGPA